MRLGARRRSRAVRSHGWGRGASAGPSAGAPPPSRRPSLGGLAAGLGGFVASLCGFAASIQRALYPRRRQTAAARTSSSLRPLSDHCPNLPQERVQGVAGALASAPDMLAARVGGGTAGLGARLGRLFGRAEPAEGTAGPAETWAAPDSSSEVPVSGMEAGEAALPDDADASEYVLIQAKQARTAARVPRAVQSVWSPPRCWRCAFVARDSPLSRPLWPGGAGGGEGGGGRCGCGVGGG
jgi:hypothetical protein